MHRDVSHQTWCGPDISGLRESAPPGQVTFDGRFWAKGEDRDELDKHRAQNRLRGRAAQAHR